MSATTDPKGPGAGLPGDTASAAAMPAPTAPAAQLRRWLQGLRPRSLRLSTRFMLVSLSLLLLVQVAGYVVIQHSIDHNAQQQLAERLTLAQRVWQRLLDQRAAKLQQAATVLAADPAIRAAVGRGDLDAVRLALDKPGTHSGATLTAWLDTRMHLQTLSEGSDPALAPALMALAPQLAQRPGSAELALVAGLPYQFVKLPLRAPALQGWVVMGVALDQSLIDDMQAVSGLQAALVALPAHAPAHVLLHSLPAQTHAGALADHLADGNMALDGEPHRVASWPLVAGHEGRVTLRLAGSVSAALAPYQRLQWLLGGITLLGLALFAFGSRFTAGRISQALRRLAAASERLGRGHYDQPVHARGGSEIADLALAFDQLRNGLAAQRQQIRELAFRDQLTELPNRLRFIELVQEAIDDGGSRPVAVLMLDLDRFKHVNDVLGYGSGDRLLQAVAARLQLLVSDGDQVARWGGDEFALLMPGANADTAMRLAQCITEAFAQALLLDDQAVDLSAGIGVAVWPDHAGDADSLLKRAEVAMHAAKRHTAGAQLYDAAVDAASALNLSLLSELHRALDNQELRLFLQPKIDIQTGAVCGAEALVRWQHPSRGLVLPMDFIPFAEQAGLIRQLTLWVFEKAAAEQVALALLGVRRVSVNLSSRDLLDQDLPDKLDAILRRHSAVAEGFCLEITERAIMNDPQRAQAALNRLSERGYRLSIDDFGTGYSSLAYLKRLPVDELKIDKSFVMAMAHDAGDAKIVRSIIDLAHNLGLSVVAEGIENENVLALLHDLRCDEGQGFHMSTPLPVADFCDWAARWHAYPPALQGLPVELRQGASMLH